MDKQGQTATEYMVLIGIVIISVVIIAMIINRSGSFASVPQKHYDAEHLKSFDVGIASFKSSASDTTLTLINNLPYAVNVTKIYFNDNSYAFGLPITLNSGRKADVTTVAVTTQPEVKFVYVVKMEYKDALTGQGYNLSDSSYVIAGSGGYE
jgi:hypothetical protein